MTEGVNGRVFLAMPATQFIPTQTVLSLLKLVGTLPPDSMVRIDHGGGSIAAKRDSLVRHFLKDGADYLLFLDSDMIFAAHMVPKLLAAQKDVIGVLYEKRIPPFGICGGMATGPNGERSPEELGYFVTVKPKTGIQRIDFLGTGVLLIRRRVFETLSDPWFWGREYEDLFFCHKARQAGFELWCDTDLEVGHCCNLVVTPRPDGQVHFSYPKD